MSKSRREFLKTASALAVASQSGSLLQPLAARSPSVPGQQRTLVVVYLRGGSDILNMVVPYKDKDYYASRPTLAIREEDGLVPLDDEFALHPALAPLNAFYKQKKFAPILNVGSPHFTRSHFDAQDFMERGAPGLRHITTGWLNRYLHATAAEGASEFRAFAMQGLLPRSLRGDYPVLAVPESMDRRSGTRVLDRFEDFYSDEMAKRKKKPKNPQQEEGEMSAAGMMGPRKEEPVVASGKQTIETLRRFQDITRRASRKKDSFGYPDSRFGKAMQSIAQVISAGEGVEIAAVDYHGWDHHAGQGSVEGRHAQMLGDYALSMAAFCRNLGDHLDNVMTLTMTEFGRTVRENGNDGTDHGRGSGMFLIGGGVKGGRILGDWVGLKSKVLADGRDLPITTDFRDVFGSCLEHCYDFDIPKNFFPEYKHREFKFV